MRTALLGLLLLPMISFGAAISGTFTGTFQGFDSFGTPQVQLNLSLQCALTCTPSAPVLTYAVAGGTSSYYAASPSDSTGYIGSGFGTAANGQNSSLNTSFKPGSVVIAEATSCSCHCGNANGQGGFITLKTDPVVIPPRFATDSISNAGRESSVLVSASPKGSESIVVQISGAGLSESRTLAPADFTSDAAFIRFTPPTAGSVTLTVTMQPSGTSIMKSWTIAAADQPSTGGGAGGGGGTSDMPGGCSALGGGPLLLLALALAKARRAA